MLIQGIRVPFFPTHLRTEHKHVLLAQHNPGLFHRDDEMFDAHFYELQHDCLSNVDEITFLPRITGVDVRGHRVMGKVVHSVRDADTLIRSFVVIEVQ